MRCLLRKQCAPWCLACAFLILAMPSALQADVTLTVAGDANIFGAGHAVPPAPAGAGGGILPPSFSFAAGPGHILTFSSVTGAMSGDGPGGPFSPPDGRWAPPWATNITSYGGISGIQFSGRVGFLVGVFLSDAEPVDPAPPVRFETDTELDIYPQLNQTFFVGNGLVGDSGAVQQFHVPADATRFYLGIADAPSWVGPPGAYGDNVGAFVATFEISGLSSGGGGGGAAVPEPGTAAFLAAPLVAGLILWRRKTV